MFSQLAQRLTANPKISLALAFAFIIFFAWAGHTVRLNNQFAVLFAIDNESNEYRHFYRQDFGADDGILLAAIELNKPVDAQFLYQLKQVSQRLSENPDYISVHAVDTVSVTRNFEDTLYLDPLLESWAENEFEPLEDDVLESVLQLWRQSPTTAGRFISVGHNVFLVMAQMPTEFDRFKRIKAPALYFQETLERNFSNSLSSGDIDIHYAGIAFTRIGILKLMHGDLFLLVPLTALVLAILTFILYRNLKMVLISFAATVFGSLATLAVMGLNNDDINQLTITFPVLLMVIVVANGIHFFHRYGLALNDGKSIDEAVLEVTEHVGRATFLSCFTTAIGFFALMTADMAILRSFGFYLGAGVMLSFVGLMLIFPAALLLLKPMISVDYHQNSFNQWFDRMVEKMIQPIARKCILCLAIVLLSIASYLASQATHDYYLKDMLDDDHPQVLAGDLLDEKVAGALPFEISLLGLPGDFLKADNLHKMLELNQWLAAQNIDEHALSLSVVLDELNHHLSAQDEHQSQALSARTSFPKSDEHIAQLMLIAQGSSDAIVDQLVSEDFSHARIRANIADVGAVEVMRLKNLIEEYAKNLFADTAIYVRVTGELPVAYEGMNKLTDELISSVITALFFIVITIALMFRDWRLVLASLFPNILPIVLGMAFYSLSGQGLNPLPGIAFCIAIGIAVDDTVHLFARFNEEISKGKSRQAAVMDAVSAVKGALFVSSFILTAGFLLFLLSGFTWNRDLGVLGAFLIIAALLADLLFTPAILAMGDQQDKQQEKQ